MGGQRSQLSQLAHQGRRVSAELDEDIQMEERSAKQQFKRFIEDSSDSAFLDVQEFKERQREDAESEAEILTMRSLEALCFSFMRMILETRGIFCSCRMDYCFCGLQRGLQLDAHVAHLEEAPLLGLPPPEYHIPLDEVQLFVRGLQLLVSAIQLVLLSHVLRCVHFLLLENCTFVFRLLQSSLLLHLYRPARPSLPLHSLLLILLVNGYLLGQKLRQGALISQEMTRVLLQGIDKGNAEIVPILNGNKRLIYESVRLLKGDCVDAAFVPEVNSGRVFLFPGLVEHAVAIAKGSEVVAQQFGDDPACISMALLLRYLSLPMASSSAQAKMLLLAECPWKSNRNYTLQMACSRLTRDLTASTSGKSCLWRLPVKRRLRSLPRRPVRWLPTITPSGLTIGTMKKSQASSSSCEASSLPTIDSIVKLEQVQLGCVLPKITMHFLVVSLLFYGVARVIWMLGICTPPSDWLIFSTLTIWCGLSCYRKRRSLLQVQGGILATSMLSPSAVKAQLKERQQHLSSSSQQYDTSSPFIILAVVLIAYFLIDYLKKHNRKQQDIQQNNQAEAKLKIDIQEVSFVEKVVIRTLIVAVERSCLVAEFFVAYILSLFPNWTVESHKDWFQDTFTSIDKIIAVWNLKIAPIPLASQPSQPENPQNQDQPITESNLQQDLQKQHEQ